VASQILKDNQEEFTLNPHLDACLNKAKSPKNDTGKTIQRLDVQVVKCKLGSAWINALTTTHNLEVGRYNDRPEVELETSKSFPQCVIGT
jgi:hypothetical protein